MNGSHIAGAGIGAIVGAILVSLGTRIGLDLTNFDAGTLGMAAVGVGLGLGHAVGEYGLSGIFRVIWNGKPKPPSITSEAGFTLVEALVVLLVIVALVVAWKH